MNGPDLEIEPAPDVELEIEPDDEPEAAAIAPEVLEPDPAPAAPSDEQAIARQATDLLSRAKAIQIVDPATFERAGAMLQTLKDQKRRIEDFFKDDVDRAHAAWKGLCNKRASYLDPIAQAITILSANYATFAREQQRQADAERRRLEEQARKAKEDELRHEAETRRQEAERIEAERATRATSIDERDQLLEQADALKGEAQALDLAAATVQAPVLHVAPSVAPPKGTSVRSNWTFEVTDKKALVNAVAAGTVSLEAIDVNGPYLRKRAQADKNSVQIPGVRFYDAATVAVRRR